MNKRIKYYDFVSVLMLLYFLFMGFITPFNFNGWTPIPLLISFTIFCWLLIVFFNRGVLTFKVSVLDQFFCLFLIHSFFSVFINSFSQYDINYNHLLAHFVVFGCYYFVIKAALANSYFGEYRMIILGMKLSFWSISLIGILDYFLTIKGVYLSDFVPMPLASPLAGSGFFVRAKGFFVEPTDFGLGLNAFGPILISYYYNRKKLLFFFLTLFTFLFAHLVSRSSAAIGFLILGILTSFVINRRFYNLKFSKLFWWLILVTIIIFMVMFFYLYEYLDMLQSEIFSKILFDSSSSSNDRRTAWNLMISVFLNGSNWFIGYGTGYVAGSELTSLNWYLSVLVENGLIGILILLFIILHSLKRIASIRSEIRFGYLISFIAVFGHLFTQSGFYFPFSWTLVAMIPFLKFKSLSLKPNVI